LGLKKASGIMAISLITTFYWFDLCNENYKTMKTLKKILEDGKTSNAHGLTDLI
jgi:hypothetical protein